MLEVHFKNGEITNINLTMKNFVRVVNSIIETSGALFFWCSDKIINLSEICYLIEKEKGGDNND